MRGGVRGHKVLDMSKGSGKKGKGAKSGKAKAGGDAKSVKSKDVKAKSRAASASPEAAPAAAETGGAPAVCVLVSRYNESVTGAMLEGAVAAYRARHGKEGVLAVVEAPGAFELPVLVATAAATGLYEGVVALGCIVRGETSHDRVLGQAVAWGLTDASLSTGVPIGFGVLTVDDVGQALARAGGDKGNKGAEAMDAVLDTIAAQRALIGALGREDPRVEHRIERRVSDKASGESGSGAGGAAESAAAPEGEPATRRDRRAAGAA